VIDRGRIQFDGPFQGALSAILLAAGAAGVEDAPDPRTLPDAGAPSPVGVPQ